MEHINRFFYNYQAHSQYIGNFYSIKLAIFYHIFKKTLIFALFRHFVNSHI